MGAWPPLTLYVRSPSGKKFRSKPQLARYLGGSMDLSTFDFRTGKMLMSKVNKGRQRVRYDSPSQVKVSPWELLLGAAGGAHPPPTTTPCPGIRCVAAPWRRLSSYGKAEGRSGPARHLPRKGPAAVCAWAPGAWSVYKSPINKCSGTLSPALIAGQKWLRAPAHALQRTGP